MYDEISPSYLERGQREWRQSNYRIAFTFLPYYNSKSVNFYNHAPILVRIFAETIVEILIFRSIIITFGNSEEGYEVLFCSVVVSTRKYRCI